MAQLDFKQCTITVEDGGSNSLELILGEGNLTWSEKKPRKYTLNRGKLDGMGIRDDDEQLVDVKLDAQLEYYKGSGTTVTPRDALTKTGGAATWESTDDDPCNPYAVNLVVHHNPECDSGGSEEITFNDFRWEDISPDLKTGMISISGKAISVTSVPLGVETNS